ncbi:MAG: Nif3-like dinuclear metal center hexameric protein, partial [Clostridia bacterium]|nr:Nif3-like dinuclear metal center hexameric protein [Clostridia bacterium]
SDIIERLEKEFPLELAYEWDNVGLLVGDRDREVKTVVTCLDVTEDVIEFAKNADAELIISHHPVLFTPINRINGDTKIGKLLMDVIENKIAIYSAHTNCDKAENGINARLAQMFGLKDVELLEEDGLGRIGNLDKPVPFCEFAKSVEDTLNIKVRFCGGTKTTVKRVAICSGSGADVIPSAIEKGADVLITGDTKYHQMLDSKDDINIIDAGHFGTEVIVTEIFAQILCDMGITVFWQDTEDVFKYL